LDKHALSSINNIRYKQLQISDSFFHPFEEPLITHHKGIFGKIILLNKRVIRKCTRFLLKPYAEKSYLFQNNVFEALETMVTFFEETSKQNSLEQEAQLANVADVHKQHIGALVQQRWSIYDAIDSLRFDDFNFCCPICAQTLNANSTERYESACIFKGGKLIRHKCHNCGGIVGPLKMLALSQEEFDLDYEQHYTIFEEGDSTEQEKLAFFQMEPEKDKVYLNYGSGAWSKCIQELKDDGWNIYGYEPYAKTSDMPNIITSRDTLATMQFDGIFSNNVLEHLRNPLEDLLFMKSILKDSSSIMVHSTPCYEYLYEYTRFHVCFFTENSIHTLCCKAGLDAYDRFDAVISNNQYSSYKMRRTIDDTIAML